MTPVGTKYSVSTMLSKENKNKNKSRNKSMKANNVNIATIAKTAESLAYQVWEATCEAPLAIAATIATLCQESGENYKQAGEAFGNAWHAIGANVEGGRPCRVIVEACFQTNLDRAAVLKFVNGAALVTKQRVSQLVAVVYDGDKSKNKGKAKSESQDVLTGEESDSGDKNPAPVTVAQILTLIQALPSVTKAEASQLAIAIKAKLA